MLSLRSGSWTVETRVLTQTMDKHYMKAFDSSQSIISFIVSMKMCTTVSRVSPQLIILLNSRKHLPCLRHEGRRCISTSSRRLVAALWGNGDYGRLGLGSLESQWSPVFCSSFHGQNLTSIACGGAHTLFLTETGHVYASGLNDFGQLGISDITSCSLVPRKVASIQNKIVQISAGYYHSCAITADGELYMWGKNSNGQLGLGKKAEKMVRLPKKVESLSGISIIMAALGSEHSVAITDKGKALSWGAGDAGRLGHGHASSMLGFWRSSSEYTPRLIKTLEGVKVTSIAAGFLHSACIDENGSLYMFGERTRDKFHLGNSSNATTPAKVGQLPFTEQVACGGYHTCVVTREGELFTWGCNENGCLGNGSTESLHIPDRVEGPFLRSPVSKVSCGWKHTAAISEGKVFTWGWGGSHGTFSAGGYSSAGQLGHGSDVDHVQPKLVEFRKDMRAIQVSCGFNHTGAILECSGQRDSF